MTPKPPQKETKLLWQSIIETENELKELAQKQMVQIMKKEMQQLREDWFKTFGINLNTKQKFMKLAGISILKNAVKYDYCFEESIKSMIDSTKVSSTTKEDAKEGFNFNK